MPEIKLSTIPPTDSNEEKYADIAEVLQRMFSSS
jgi:hypothetical protein